jgi:site-specific DNA recombinase
VKAVIYTRVARDDSGTGEASNRQLAECQRYAADHGYDVIGVMSDTGVSAYRGRRPNFDTLMKIVDEGSIDVIVTPQMSRLTRNVAEMADMIDRCEQTDVRIVTLEDRNFDLDLSTAQGRMFARLMVAVLESESRQRSERIKAGIRAARERRATEGASIDDVRPNYSASVKDVQRHLGHK